MSVREIKMKDNGLDGVSVEWDTPGLGPGGDITVQHRMKGSTPPHPDMGSRWKKVVPEAIALLGFKIESRDENDEPIADTGESITSWDLRTVRWHGGGGDESVSFSLVRQVPRSNRPLNINTPPFELDIDEPALRASFRKLLSELRKEAGAYVKGKSAQGELDLGLTLAAQTGGVAELAAVDS